MLLLAAAGCSEQANTAGRSGCRFADTPTAQPFCNANASAMTDEQLNRAILAPFSAATYEQTRRRQWVREAGHALGVAADKPTPTEQTISDSVR